jgi:hypothetical protein
VFVTEPLLGSLTHLVKSSDSYSSETEEPGLDLDELEVWKKGRFMDRNEIFTSITIDSKGFVTSG